MIQITGGLGGQWVWVENLNPSGPLSLRDALTRTDILGPRNIGFKVSGDIFGSIDVDTVKDFTVHGATSPGGICLRNEQNDIGNTLNIQTDNIIIDNIRIRPGSISGGISEARRALNFQRTKGAIVRNCSLTWAYDQIAGGWYGTEDLVFYRNIIAEGFHARNGKYGMGALVGDASGGSGGGDVYFYQNVFAHNRGRNPKTNIAGVTYLWNNLVYNPGDWVMDIDNRFGNPIADLIGNVVIRGEQGNNNADWLVKADGNASLYVKDNLTPKRQWGDSEEISNIVYDSTNNTYRNNPIQMPFYPMVDSQDLENHLLSVAGARPLDAADSRILDSIRNRSGEQINDENLVGGYPDLSVPEIPKSVIISIPFNVKSGNVTGLKFEDGEIEIEVENG